MYNGRDGVVTDDNGLIYMRARYYSPELRRFVNADIIAGKITNAITLNRYAYANGNPVSFVDPLGLSAERGGLSDAQYNLFLDVFNEIFTTSFENNLIEYNDGITKYYYKVEHTFGEGMVDPQKLSLGQISLVQSYDISKGSFETTIGNDTIFSVKYSAQIDEYSTVSGYISFSANNTYSAEFQVSTSFEDGHSLTTILGAESKLKNHTINPNSSEVKGTVPVVSKEEKNKINWPQIGDFAPALLFLAGTICIVGGLYYFIQTGDSSIIQQGTTMMTQGAR